MSTPGAGSSYANSTVVASGDDHDAADFGYYEPASLGDYVWLDLDDDYESMIRRRVVVADPDVEQVTEDEQAVTGLRIVHQEIFEQGERGGSFGCQVEIRDEPLFRHGAGL